MKKRTLIAIVIIGILCVVGVIVIKLTFFRYPDTLPVGQDPKLILPLYSFANNSYIGGFGQVNPTYYHNGIDFGVNASTIIVSSHDAYVDDIKFWYNDKGGHWQTNVRFWLNSQWEIEIVFESWANNETFGQFQHEAVIVSVGQYVAMNQTIGRLLCQGSSAHIHFQISSGNTQYCPYHYFTSAAQAALLTQFYRVNRSAYLCM